MKRAPQLLIIAFLAISVTSLLSHLTVHWLQVRATVIDCGRFGPPEEPVQSFLAGSSLAFHGLDWSQIARSLGEAIETRTAAGSSPSEWEVLARNSSGSPRTIAVVSAYDLNEFWLCDFRGEIVPVGQTVRDLWRCHADWTFSKRMLSQYPLAWVRKLFPTAGRSGGVMVGIRAKLIELSRLTVKEDTELGPRLGVDGNAALTERLSDWSAARLQRRLVLMRGACAGRHSFRGPKRLALLRLLATANQQGQAVVVVLPVSPAYQNEFLSPAVAREFEESLAEVHRQFSSATIIRLDQLPEIQHDELFSDLVHLNRNGQQVATDALLARWKPGFVEQ